MRFVALAFLAAVAFASALHDSNDIVPEDGVAAFEDPTSLELIEEVADNAGGTNSKTDGALAHQGTAGAGAKQAFAGGPASGGVDSIIPEFEDVDTWRHSDKQMRDGYRAANDHYKSINAKEHKAQGERREELSNKAQAAKDALKAQKEKMQKKYAKDDPTDYRKHHYNTADLADERRYKKAPVKLGGSGSWGSSGTPDKQKWYSDGVISSDGWVDKKGHYLLGAHRRRVGAGFGRRRNSESDHLDPIKAPDGNDIKEMEKGHPALQEAFGDPKKIDAKAQEAGKHVPAVISKDAGISKGAFTGANKDETVGQKEAKVDAALALKNEVKAHKENINEADKQALNTTKAGTSAILDKDGHFVEATNEKVVGHALAKELSAAEDTVKTCKAHKCFVHGGNNMPMYSAAGCKSAGGDAKFAGVQAKYDNCYGECLKVKGGSYTWDNRGVCKA